MIHLISLASPTPCTALILLYSLVFLLALLFQFSSRSFTIRVKKSILTKRTYGDYKV